MIQVFQCMPRNIVFLLKRVYVMLCVQVCLCVIKYALSMLIEVFMFKHVKWCFMIILFAMCKCLSMSVMYTSMFR